MTSTTDKQAKTEPSPEPRKCETCDATATHIWVDMAEVYRRRNAYQAWDARRDPSARVDIAALSELPSEAVWHMTCNDCYPHAREEEGADFYWFVVPQTWREWVRWTKHLMGKRWLEYTNWQRFM